MPRQTPDTIRALLQQVADGDQLAFRKLFDQYRPNIYTTALRIVGNEWIAEEIVQDTFMKIWLKRTALPQVENFQGWLHTIARNLTLNSLKQLQQERQQLLQMTRDAMATEGLANMAEETRFQEVLEQAVARLPEKQKQTYILIKQQEFKRDEVARQLNVSPETVKWNLEQAIKSVRKYCLAHLDQVPPVLGLYFFMKYF